MRQPLPRGSHLEPEQRDDSSTHSDSSSSSGHQTPTHPILVAPTNSITDIARLTSTLHSISRTSATTQRWTLGCLALSSLPLTLVAMFLHDYGYAGPPILDFLRQWIPALIASLLVAMGVASIGRRHELQQLGCHLLRLPVEERQQLLFEIQKTSHRSARRLAQQLARSLQDTPSRELSPAVPPDGTSGELAPSPKSG